MCDAEPSSASAPLKNYEFSLLLDFYGDLLPAGSRELLDLSCNEDYSLGEIAQLRGISRQAAHDGIRRAEDALLKYESCLQLAFRRQTALKLIADCRRQADEEGATESLQKKLGKLEQFLGT
ncbi:DNA-binding protein [Oscillospiraceae bacterium HV4-5-C5C]|nr:DNA-binding protein [Oscillospiraceae bacterium HV4-5-C5C]